MHTAPVCVIDRQTRCKLIPRSACRSLALARWGCALRGGNARQTRAERKGAAGSRALNAGRLGGLIAVLLARNGAHRIVTRSLAGGTESAAGARAQFTEGYRAERDGTERRNGR